MQNMNVSNEQRNKGRRDFLLLVAVFFTPIIIALFLYSNLERWGIGGDRNHGNLIEPPRKLKDVALSEWQDGVFNFSDIRDKWVMFRFGGAECGEKCEKDLYLMRQIRRAQGGDRHRVKRVYISTEGKPKKSLQDVLPEHPEMHVVYGDSQAIQKVIKQFQHDIGRGANIQSMYVADPRGFLMMSYPANYEARGVIKDMARLLKFARSG